MATKDWTPVISLFDELGWGKAKMKQVAVLPLGTAEQHKLAKRLLSSGQLPTKNGANPLMLSLFALRLGVAPKRVVQLLRRYNSRGDHRLVAQCVAEHDAEYATGFIDEAARSNDIEGSRLYVDSDFNAASFFILSQYFPEIPIPSHENYLYTWSFLAAHALKIPEGDVSSSRDSNPTLDEIMPTLREHLHACFAGGLDMWGMIGHVALRALHRNEVEREKVVAAAFYSLSTAVRPGQRRRMVEILTKELNVTDDEIREHFEILTGCLTTADPIIISAFGKRAIALAPADAIGDLVLPMLYVTTLKGQKDTLSAVVRRGDIPAGSQAILTERVAELAGSTDEKVAGYATKLLSRWGAAGDGSSTSEETVIYPWNDPPQLWALPRFERIAPTPDSIIDAIRHKAVSEPTTTVESEQCLVAFHQLATADIDAAKRLSTTLGSQAPWWFVIPETPDIFSTQSYYGYNSSVGIRNAQLQHTIGTIPNILSEPSYVDLSITVDDLLARLAEYADSGAHAIEADFTLALSRLILDGIDVAAAQAEACRYQVPILRPINETDDVLMAGEILANFIADPYLVPEMMSGVPRNRWEYGEVFQPRTIPTPRSLRKITERLTQDIYRGELNPAAVPRWGDVGWTQMKYRKTATNAVEGALALQAARSATALEPGTAMNLIALLQPTAKGGLELAQQAISDAWNRGLLRPGVADPRYLNWDPHNTTYTAIATIAVELAETGMLAVAWQLLDDILVLSSKRPASSASTSAIAQAMAQLAPSIAQAISQGQAPAKAANVPGLRHLAAKPTKNKTTTAARAALAVLPEPTEATEATSIAINVDLSAWEEPQPNVIADDATCTLVAPTTIAVEFPPSDTTNLIGEKTCYISIFELRNFLNYQELTLYTDGGFDSGWSLFAKWSKNAWHISEKASRGFPKDNLQLTTTVLFTLLGALVTGKEGTDTFTTVSRFLTEGKISAEAIRTTTKLLARNELWSPARALSLLKTDDQLHYLWPLLTECISAAAEAVESGANPPKWLTKVLDVVSTYSHILVAATQAGFIPANSWEPLTKIAQHKKKTAAVQKAAALTSILSPVQKAGDAS